MGAALAALARRSPARTVKQDVKKRLPVVVDTNCAVTPYTPWTRRSRPLYKF